MGWRNPPSILRNLRAFGEMLRAAAGFDSHRASQSVVTAATPEGPATIAEERPKASTAADAGTSAAQRPRSPNPIGALYEWPIARELRLFRGVVVEIGRYDPPNHARWFQDAIQALLSPGQIPVAGLELTRSRRAPEFDLATFPEAFLPIAELHSTLESFRRSSARGIVHVGLRRNDAAHLISTTEFRGLVSDLSRSQLLCQSDSRVVEQWLGEQEDVAQFNVGCVFGVDASGALRICLHPKLVRSKYEVSVSWEKHMTEAGLFSLIALIPEDERLLPIYLQPLLCSDALNIEMDRPSQHPLTAITSGRVRFHRRVEHIDIVSVSSCTPASAATFPNGSLKDQWHEDFRESARRMGEDPDTLRHHGAILMQSNYRSIEDIPNAGISGVFLPCDLKIPFTDSELRQAVYGSVRREANRWFADAEVRNLMMNWGTEMRSRGHIVALSNSQAIASVLRFTVNHLPRDARGWRTESALRNLGVFDLGGDGVREFMERGRA